VQDHKAVHLGSGDDEEIRNGEAVLTTLSQKSLDSQRPIGDGPVHVDAGEPEAFACGHGVVSGIPGAVEHLQVDNGVGRHQPQV